MKRNRHDRRRCIGTKRLPAVILAIALLVTSVPLLAYAGDDPANDYCEVERSVVRADGNHSDEKYEIMTDENTEMDDTVTSIMGKSTEMSIQAAPSNELSGYCGKDGGTNVAWAFDPESGTLTLTGKGEMDTCNDEAFWGQMNVVPWYNYREQIRAVSISDGITYIGWWAFAHSQITEITFPASVKGIGQGALAYCKNLKTVNLNDGLETIEGSVFKEDSFQELVFPASVKEITSTALHDSQIDSLSVRGSDPGLKIDDGVIFSSDMKKLYYCDPSKTGSYKIPQGVSIITDYSFWGCGIQHIDIPDSVKEIHGRAFAETALREVVIPDSVTRMDYGAFTGCTQVETIKIGNGITSLEVDVFGYNSSATSILIGSGVKTIESYAFNGASSVKTLELPDSVTKIDRQAFINCTSLESVDFGKNLKTIEYGAFAGCTNLGKIVLPTGLETIGDGAFYGTSIDKVVVPATVNSIGKDAFPPETELILPPGMIQTDTGAYTTMNALCPVEINVKYGQSEARSMLDMVNSMRTGNDAWYWNQSNTKKEVITGLSVYTYDYELEKVAMQRAAEIAVSFSHTRPNGSDCFSAFNGHGEFTYEGENIAIGQQTASQAFESWAEKNEKYDGQGHRRNMLSDSFNAIGIGHAVVNGVHCWVQDFGYTSSPNTNKTAANDSNTAVKVFVSQKDTTVNSSKILFARSRTEVGDLIDTPNIQLVFTMKENWGGATTGTVRNIVWTAATPDIAVIEDDRIRAVSNGIASFTSSILGKRIEAKIGVGQDAPSQQETVYEPTYSYNDDWWDDYDFEEEYYEVIKLPAVKLSKPKAGKGSINVKWKKVSKKNLKKIQGIEIQIATDSSFSNIVKTVTVGKSKKSKKIGRLKKKTKYWVRIRAYRNAYDCKYVSAWKIKKVRTK